LAKTSFELGELVAHGELLETSNGRYAQASRNKIAWGRAGERGRIYRQFLDLARYLERWESN